jgi:hypothetical protein
MIMAKLIVVFGKFESLLSQRGEAIQIRGQHEKLSSNYDEA